MERDSKRRKVESASKKEEKKKAKWRKKGMMRRKRRKAGEAELSQMHAPGALHNLSTAVLHSFVSPTCLIALGPLALAQVLSLSLLPSLSARHPPLI